VLKIKGGGGGKVVKKEKHTLGEYDQSTLYACM
jgi:hypothetical protein